MLICKIWPIFPLLFLHRRMLVRWASQATLPIVGKLVFLYHVPIFPARSQLCASVLLQHSPVGIALNVL